MTRIVNGLKFLAAVFIATFLGRWLKFDEGFSLEGNKGVKGAVRGLLS